MATSQSRRYGSSHIQRSQSRQDSSNEEDTIENDGPVFKTIEAIRNQHCKKLKGLLGELSQGEEIQKGLRRIYDSKKCCFIDTEYNYQVYRNLELSVGVEVIQASAEIKQNITSYIALSDSLATALKAVVKAAKEAKQKFSDLRKAACELNICRNDKCNCTQILVLTGKSPCNGNDENKRPVRPACPGADEILDHLVEDPEYFSKDSDIILNSAADVTGIQTFTNIRSLESLQQSLATSITAFDTLVVAKMNQGATDLAACQTDLVAAIKELTRSDYALYNKRDEIDAEKETIEYICEYECNCIRVDDDEDRLKDCKNDICDICGQLDDIYCERHKQTTTTHEKENTNVNH